MPNNHFWEEETSMSVALSCSSTGGGFPLLPLLPDAPVPLQVKMAFSEDRALPGSVLQLELDAAPGSLCAIRAVDRSVLLLKPEAELNAEAVSGGNAQGPFCSAGTSQGCWGER